MRTSDGNEVIDRLAKKYLGVDQYPYLSAGEVRVTMVIEVESVAGDR